MWTTWLQFHYIKLKSYNIKFEYLSILLILQTNEIKSTYETGLNKMNLQIILYNKYSNNAAKKVFRNRKASKKPFPLNIKRMPLLSLQLISATLPNRPSPSCHGNRSKWPRAPSPPLGGIKALPRNFGIRAPVLVEADACRLRFHFRDISIYNFFNYSLLPYFASVIFQGHSENYFENKLWFIFLRFLFYFIFSISVSLRLPSWFPR